MDNWKTYTFGPIGVGRAIPCKDGEFVTVADAQATVDLAKAEGAAEVRKVIQQRLIDVRLARSVARLSFAQDEYDAQISALESILKQCEEPFSSNNENGLDLQATVEALQRERNEARHTADVYQKLYGTAVMDRAIVHNEKADLQAALDAEREKAKNDATAYRKLSEQWNATDLELSQLQALVRAFFTSEDKWAVAYRELERLGYTLDAMMPVGQRWTREVNT